MMEFITNLLAGGMETIIGFTAIALVLAFLYKIEFLGWLIKNGKNGKNRAGGEENEFSDLKLELEEIKSNHLHEVKEILIEIKTELKEMNEKQSESLYILRDLKK